MFKTGDRYPKRSNTLGYSAGAWTRIGLPFIYLQPELYATRKNINLKIDGGASPASNESANGNDRAEYDKIRITSLDVPILIGTRFVNSDVGFRFSTGPVFSFILDQNENSNDIDSFKNQIRSWQFGSGIDITEKIGLDLKYEFALSTVGNGAYEKSSLDVLTFGLTYKIR